MSLPDDRVPTLVQYCQRVAALHVDSISSLGDDLRYDLVKPILERCTVDQLIRLEQASPYLQKETPEIWKSLCFRTYPAAKGRNLEPDSWKEQYFDLVQEEARKFEAVGSKIRQQRLQAEERKKESEIKITTQLPTGKRRWGVSVQPKTLFQKTRSEASRLQKNMYGRPMLKNHRVLPAANCALLPTSTSNSRVTVNTVVHRVSVPGPSHKTPPSSQSFTVSTGSSSPVESPRKKPRLADLPSESQLPKPMAVKRDPMASLFLPKHRAYSQRINQEHNVEYLLASSHDFFRGRGTVHNPASGSLGVLKNTRSSLENVDGLNRYRISGCSAALRPSATQPRPIYTHVPLVWATPSAALDTVQPTAE